MDLDFTRFDDRPMPDPGKPDLLSEVVAKLQIADPAVELPLDGRLLCRNMLVIGGVGSGKTTSVIFPILRQSIAFRADEPENKCGLFVMDSKVDGTMERVVEWAKACGREDDLRVIGGGTEWGYDPFASTRSLYDIDRTAEKVASGFQDAGSDNAYWTTTATNCLRAALMLLLLKDGTLELQPTLESIGRILVTTSSLPEDFREIQRRLPDLLTSEFDAIRLTLLASSEALEGFHKLDPRTRTILQTIFAATIRSLTGLAMADYYPGNGRKSVDIAEIVREGRILVLRAPAHEPCVAEALGRMIKCDLYGEIRSRPVTGDRAGRLFGLFFDEYPLVATGSSPLFGDVEALQTMREKRGFVVAATQGLVSMRNAVGQQAWDSLALNFTSKIFLGSQEPEVEAFARAVLGTREKQSRFQTKQTSEAEDHDETRRVATVSQEFSIQHEDTVIQPGDIARLAEHCGYYSLPGGIVSTSPAFFVPDYSSVVIRPIPSARDRVEAQFRALRQRLNPRPQEEIATAAESHAESDPQNILFENAGEPPPKKVFRFTEPGFPIFRRSTWTYVRMEWMDNPGFPSLSRLPRRPPANILEFLQMSESTRDRHLGQPAVREMLLSARSATEVYISKASSLFTENSWLSKTPPRLSPKRRAEISVAAREWMRSLNIPIDELDTWPRRPALCGGAAKLERSMARAEDDAPLLIEIPEERISSEFLRFAAALSNAEKQLWVGRNSLLWLDDLPVLHIDGAFRRPDYAFLLLTATLAALTSVYIVPSQRRAFR